MKKISNKDILDRFLEKKRKPAETPSKNLSYVIVRNIPNQLHSKDLRKYFSGFVENGLFECFHYRHRPELQAGEEGDAKKTATCCCLVSFRDDCDREAFIKEFSGRNWEDSHGMQLARKCYIDRLKIQSTSEPGTSTAINEQDLKEMIELKPPTVMPNGNIGTPSEYFVDQIRLCKIPSSIIPKLGIQAAKRRRKFGEVPFCYGESEKETGNAKEFETPKMKIKEGTSTNEDVEEEDDDECEEWERHEALHDDVTEQDRTKPRKYEEEMEVTWEKGGPGLVWHTDKNYWDEREKGTDCDWAWADDWDVDYSVYYEGKSAGDLDAKAAVEMRQDELMRSGKLEQSVFTKKKREKTRKRRNSEGDSNLVQKGIGGVLLTKMGWKPGTGLGRNKQGKIEPVAISVEEDGQSGREHKGFGYKGEKLSRFVEKKPVKHAIASIFDQVNDQHTKSDEAIPNSDFGEVLFRRPETTIMKYS